MGEGSAHRGRQTEVNRPHAAEVSRPHAEEVSRPHPVEVSRARHVELSPSCRAHLVMQSSTRHAELSSSCRVELVTSGHSSLQVTHQSRSARQICLRMTSNFGRSYLLRPNSDSGVLGLYEKPIESRIH